jgi:thiol:disulfide interchange protein DsbD
MFDVYQLQLPSALQSRLTESSGRQSGGKIIGVFVMGALSALIVGPCAGPLAGALLYISQTGNAATGGWALFAMAAGMSVPLLLTGLSAGSSLPRAGAWMNNEKSLRPAADRSRHLDDLTCAAGDRQHGAVGRLRHPVRGVPAHRRQLAAGAGIGAYAGKALGVVMLLGGLFERWCSQRPAPTCCNRWRTCAGGGSSGRRAGSGHDGLRFTRIRTVAELDKVLASTTKPVMLDFYADWCVACKEMERMTFSEGRVAAAMQEMLLIQADVTANNADDRADEALRCSAHRASSCSTRAAGRRRRA